MLEGNSVDEHILFPVRSLVTRVGGSVGQINEAYFVGVRIVE